MDGESKRSHNRLGVILQNEPSEPESLPLDYLREITNNFCDDHLLGTGGFGIVYKGVVQNGDMIAVKKLTLTTPEIQDRQFENEVRHLMGLKHPNIVQLVGYCSEAENTLVEYNGKLVCAEKPERLICLEYLPKGSLHEHLSDESSGLDWNTRYKIIQGICSGLQYLHEEWKVNTPIIHMDLKPPNILLDENMMPKITDFGLSRLFGEEQTRICTRSRDGTLGYMPPEYLNRGIITTKSDIFSLGVIIIEIMTGRKDYPYETTETSLQKFIEPVIKNWRNRLEKLPKYGFWKTDCQQIRRCIQTGLACMKPDWEERPTIREIIKMLHGKERERSRKSGSGGAAMARSSVPVPLVGGDQHGAAPAEKQPEHRRGPWTKEEFRTLIAYIAKHGEPGNSSCWDSVARKAGLKRTGSSCQVRWLNCIRPDVKHGNFTAKHGNFTAEEQLLILENRLSWIAQHLPGRIDIGITHAGAKAIRQLGSQRQAAQAPHKQKKKK